ncbi:MAG TPA: hypothetical protein VHM91_22680 [Verrucomicrobiales bacterium]|jgi:hypothetical protein|nr:hypothetical protein [Verrucomicrobiales bacterium]
MKLPAIQRCFALSVIFLFVADLPPPPPPRGDVTPSPSRGGCSKSSQAFYMVRPALYGSATK